MGRCAPYLSKTHASSLDWQRWNSRHPSEFNPNRGYLHILMGEEQQVSGSSLLFTESHGSEVFILVLHPDIRCNFSHIVGYSLMRAGMLTFEELYKKNVSEVYRFAYWLAGDHNEAEDVTSETFIRAWTCRATIRTETLKAYLFAIARNAFLQRRRKTRRFTALKDQHADPDPGPVQLTEQRIDINRVHRTLQTLPEIDRAAFVLRVEYELPYIEIARALEISLSAAKVKVHRVRKKLMQDRHREEGRV
jgi:RNA polymerase sigma factor (sigma-70 family)